MPKKKTKNMYFNEIHEQAVLDYLSEKDALAKEKIYIDILKPVVTEMIEKIVFSYRFDRVLDNIQEYIADCLSYVATIIHNYSSDKKSKAFTYLSVVIRNYFFNVVKKNVTKSREKVTETGDPRYFESIPEEFNLEEEIERQQFLKCLNKNLDLWIGNKHSTEDEIRVLMAIKVLLETIDDYDCLNKKAFYIYLKDVSGLTSKQLSSALKKIKVRYSIFLSNWNYGIKQ